MEQSKRKRARKPGKAVADTMDFQMAVSGAPSPSALEEPHEISDSSSPKPGRRRGRPKKALRHQNLAAASSASPLRWSAHEVSINGEHGEASLGLVALESPPMWDKAFRAVSSMDAVVKVFCVHTEPNFSLPWQRKRQYSSSSSGFIIGDRRVLTNAHSVEHYTQVKLEKRGSDTKYVATVLAIGSECDIDQIFEEEDKESAEDQRNAVISSADG